MLYILNVFVIQAAIFWLLFKSFGNLAKKKAQQSQHEKYADQMQKILQALKVDDEALKARYRLMLDEYDKVQHPIVMAAAFMFLAIVFTVLSLIAALIYFL